MVANTISTFQSLTVHCARCHDHKFDPIPQEDYYRLQAVFAGVDRGDRPYLEPARPPRWRRGSWRSRRAARRCSSRPMRRPAPSWPRSTRNWPRSRTGSRRWPARSALLVSPTQRLPQRDRAEARRRAVGPGRPRPPGPHRRGPPRPGPPDRLRRHAGLRLPGPLPGRAWPTTPTFDRPDRLADHTERISPTRATRPSILRAGAPTARYVRVTATRLWPRTDDYVFALGELEVISGGRERRLGGAGHGARLDRGGAVGPRRPGRRLRQPGQAPRPGRPRAGRGGPRTPRGADADHARPKPGARSSKRR